MAPKKKPEEHGQRAPIGLYDNETDDEIIRIPKSELENMAHSLWFEGYKCAVHHVADCFAESPLPFGEKIADEIISDFEDHQDEILGIFNIDFMTASPGVSLKRTGNVKPFIMPVSPSKYYN